MQASWWDCTRYGLKCLVATVIARASISHGNSVHWEPRSLVLEKPAGRNLSLLVTYSVAPILGLQNAPFITIHGWSLGMGSEIVWAMVRADWALWNDARRSSVHWVICLDSQPAMVSSRFAIWIEHPGMMRENTLKALMNDLIRATLSGFLAWGKSGDCGQALKVPEFQVQPSVVVDWGLMILLAVERRRSHLCRACKTSSDSAGVHLGSFRRNTGRLQFWLQCLPLIGHQAFSSWVLSGPSQSLACPW